MANDDAKFDADRNAPITLSTPAIRREVDPQFRKQLEGFSLTTAEITYHMPDSPALLQTFLWQEYDMAPRFPKLGGFLTFWQKELDGPIHSVRVANAQLLRPLELRSPQELTVH